MNSAFKNNPPGVRKKSGDDFLFLVFDDFLMIFGFSAIWEYAIPNLCKNLPWKLFFVPEDQKTNVKN